MSNRPLQNIMKYLIVSFLLSAMLYGAEKVTVISKIEYSSYEKNVDNDGNYVIEKTDRILKAGDEIENNTEKPMKLWLKKRSSKDKQGWIQLEPKSKLKLNSSNNQRKEKVIFDLSVGSIKINHAWKLKKDEVFTIRTPSAVSGVRGTQYELSFQEGETTTKTIESTVYVKKEGDDKEVDVVAGSMVATKDVIGNIEAIPEAELAELEMFFARELVLGEIASDNPKFYENEQIRIEMNNKDKNGIAKFHINGFKTNVILRDYTLINDLSFLKEYSILNFQVRNFRPKTWKYLSLLKDTTYIILETDITDKELMYLPEDLPLDSIGLNNCKEVKSLLPISRFSKLTHFSIRNCDSISDLTPIRKLNLETIVFSPKNIKKGWEYLKAMNSLKEINADGKAYTPEEFWKAYDAGEFK